jgi:hypothetical protein
MQRRRPRRNGQANVKTRVGIAASALVLAGGAAAVVIASHGSTPSAAQSASYNFSYGGHQPSAMAEWGMLNSAVSDWGRARQSSMSQLAGSMGQQTFGQTTEHGKTLDEQRGMVVFASKHFLILQSKNGSLHLWLLSGKTQFANVATSTTGTTAMTGSSSVAQQAVDNGYMNPLVDLFAGSMSTADRMLTPSTRPQTVSVQVAGTDLTVTVTITENTAKVNQTGTMPATGTSVTDPTTSTMSTWSTAGSATSLARGDTALVVGTRSHGLLHAEVVLYTPLSTTGTGTTPTASPSATPSVSPSITPTATVSPTVSATPTASATATPTSPSGFSW